LRVAVKALRDDTDRDVSKRDGDAHLSLAGVSYSSTASRKALS
jgi:hypothetical protein